MTMKTSPAGVRALEQREGVRLKAYQDSRGIWTIGVGMITWRGRPVAAGMTITQADLDREFPDQLEGTERAVSAAVRVALTQNQFDALVSFAWNVGPNGFASSQVVQCLNRGDYVGAAAAFMNWCKPPELRSRRESEIAQFKTPDAALTPSPATTEDFSPKPPHAAPQKAAKPKAKIAAGAVAGGAVVAAGVANATGSTLWPWVLVVVALIAVAAFVVLHIRKA